MVDAVIIVDSLGNKYLLLVIDCTISTFTCFFLKLSNTFAFTFKVQNSFYFDDASVRKLVFIQ